MSLYEDNRSVASSRSRGSQGKYKLVSHRSEVDESLFGTNKPKQTQTRTNNNVGIVSKKTLQTAGRTLSRGRMTDAILLPRSEIERIKQESIVKTQEDIIREKEEREMMLTKQNEKAIARKTMMIHMEEERKKIERPSTAELEKREKDRKILENARIKNEERMDEVKKLNQMADYAKTVTIRELQMNDRLNRERKEQDIEHQLDLELEIQRLKEVDKCEEADRIREEKNRLGGKELRAQMADRERRRQLEIQRNHEEEMRVVEKYKQEEIDAKNRELEKRRIQRETLMQVLAENRENEKLKAELIEKDRELDRKLLQYALDEAEAQRQHDLEEKAKARAREMEIARLRAQQEKFMDEKAALDELRAKRAMEAKEREERAREIREAEKKVRDRQMLLEAYEDEIKAKQERQAKEIQFRRIEYENSKQQYDDAMREAAEERRLRIEKNHYNLRQLQEQMRENEEKRGQENWERIHAADNSNEEYEEHLAEVEAIKQRKIRELEAAGIEPKYLAEIKKYDARSILLKDYQRGGKRNGLCDR